MYRSSFRTAVRRLPFALFILGACDAPSTTAPELAPALSRRAPQFEQQIAACPTTRSYRAERTLGPRGGSISAGHHRLTVPRGVLTEPTRFTLYAPAGQEVKIELSANGESHYEFAAPVAVTISYERCARQHLPPTPMTAWYVDDAGTRFLERMGGRDDRIRKTVTFRTTHFSTYLVAY